MLNKNKEVNEMGLSIPKLKKTIPQNYLLKSIKEKEKRDKEKKQIKELYLIKEKILFLFKNLDWRRIKIKNSEYDVFLFRYPENIEKEMINFKTKYEKIAITSLMDLEYFYRDIKYMMSDNVDINLESNHRTHFSGIPESFKGMNLGFKLYRKLVDSVGYIMSDISASDGVKIIYYQLTQEKDLNCVVTKKDVLIIKKDWPKMVPIEKFLEFSSIIRFKFGVNIIFDSDLQKKLGMRRINALLTNR
jgi:hypothetical protein